MSAQSDILSSIAKQFITSKFITPTAELIFRAADANISKLPESFPWRPFCVEYEGKTITFCKNIFPSTVDVICDGTAAKFAVFNGNFFSLDDTLENIAKNGARASFIEVVYSKHTRLPDQDSSFAIVYKWYGRGNSFSVAFDRNGEHRIEILESGEIMGNFGRVYERDSILNSPNFKLAFPEYVDALKDVAI